MSVVIWSSLLIQEMSISDRDPEWKTSMQLGHRSVPSTKLTYFKAKEAVIQEGNKGSSFVTIAFINCRIWGS